MFEALPSKVSVPAPVFRKPTLRSKPSAMMPLKVLLPAPFTVSVVTPGLGLFSVTVPAPERAATVVLNSFKSNVAPVPTVTAAVAGMPVALPGFTVPPVMFSAPKLFTPVSVRVFDRFFVTVPRPPRLLAMVMSSERLKASEAPAATAASPLPSVPVVPPAPICKVPPFTFVTV